MLHNSFTLFPFVSTSTRRRLLRATFALFICASAGLSVHAQSTEFTYQGLMNNSGAPANGNFDQQKQINKQNEVIKKQRADLDALMALVCSLKPVVKLCRSKN